MTRFLTMITKNMPYSDPQRGRDAVRVWRLTNPEMVKQQRKMAIIKKAVKQQRLPRLSSIARHGLSADELRCIVDAVMCGQDEPVVASIGKVAIERTSVVAV